MTIFQPIDLNTILPVAGLAAIAIVVIVVLLVRTVLHSRLALVIAIIIGVVAAGPVLGGLLVAALNIVAVALIVGAGATIAVLLIIRSHPDLLALARDALSLLPRQQPPGLPPIPSSIEAPRPNAIQIIDQPRRITHRNSGGSDWGF